MHPAVTASLRLIVLLDNALSAAQVRTLLPGPASLVVVTTRRRIAGLAMDGARFVNLDPLDEQAAVELLGQMLGTDRVEREREAARQIAAMCGNLPLAVCVCAARLAPHPGRPLASIAGELADEHRRLATLSLPGDISVQAAFDLSYQALPKPAARLYRLASLLPGPDFGPELVAAALTIKPHRAAELLEMLADASLLEETAQQRFRFHDLVRLHARQRADGHSPGERHAVIAWAVNWYLWRVVADSLVISPHRWRLNPMYEQARGSPPAHADAGQALDALEADLPRVLAAVRIAYAEGLHTQAWQLCEAIWELCMHRKLFVPWISLHQVGLPSARACGNRRAEARMSVQLGVAYLAVGQLAEASHLFTRALELDQQEGHRIGVATALEQLGLADLAQDHSEAAIGRFTQARAIFHELGHPRGVALMTCRVGEARTAAGQPGQAIAELQRASSQFAALPDPYMRARALTSLAQAYLSARQPARAGPLLDDALATMIEFGSHYEQARIHVVRADIARQLDEHTLERRCLQRAVSAYSAVGAPEAETTQLRLDDLADDAAPGRGEASS